MSAIRKAEARVRRGERGIERMLKRHRSVGGQVLADIERRLESAPGPTAAELPHLARAINEAIVIERLAADALLGLYRYRLAREVDAGGDDELAADTVH